MTRPNIAYVVKQVCQFTQNPQIAHLIAAKCILRYVKGTLHLGLRFYWCTHLHLRGYLHLRAFSDSVWAGCPDDWRSIIGFVICLRPDLLSSTAKKQAVVSRSSTEAEYRALASLTTEILWFLHVLQTLRIRSTTPPILYCDNISSLHLAKNPISHHHSGY